MVKSYIKKTIKLLISKLGYTVFPKNHTFPKTDAFLVQKDLLNTHNEIVIFDVGAHFGETVDHYKGLFENCRIYSFEPFLDSFKRLEETASRFQKVYPFNVALSNEDGSVVFNLNKESATNSLLNTGERGADTWWVNALETDKSITVTAAKLDTFMLQHNIDHIDILKLDTQGSEYLVIDGALRTITEGKIKLVYLEIITMPTYENQKHLDEMIELLRLNGFSLYDFYNYNYSDKGQLRQVDAIFFHHTFKI